MVRAVAAEKKESETAKKLLAIQAELESEKANRSLDLSQSLSGTTSTETARIQKLVNEKRNLSLEVQGLKEARDSAEARAKSLSCTVEKLQKQVASLEDSARADKAPKTRGAPAAEQASKLRALEAELKERDGKAAELLGRVRALEAEVRDRDTKLAESTKSSKKAAAADGKQAAALQARLEAAEAEAAAARRECQDLRETAARERAEHGAELATAHQQRAELERRVRGLEVGEGERGSRKLAAQADALRAEAAGLREANRELEARQEQSDATAAEQEGRLARLLVRLEEGSSASAHLEKGMQVRRERPL